MAAENITSATFSQVNQTHPCAEKKWTSLIALTLSGGGVLLSCVIVAVAFQLWISRHLAHLALKIKLQLHVGISLFITLIVFLIDNLPRDERLSSTTCQTLGSLFHFALLSSFFWLATEMFVCWLDLRATIKRTTIAKQLLVRVNIVNWGLPLLIVIIVHIISVVNDNLYGISINVSTGSSIKRQFCWFKNNTALVVAMVIPAAIVWFSTLVVGVYVQWQCHSLRLKRPPTSRLLLPGVFGPVWVFGGLSVLDLSSSRSDMCEPIGTYSILFSVGSIMFGLLICWQHSLAAWELRFASRAEQGRKKLVFKEKRPNTLGSDGFLAEANSPSSPNSVVSQETMNTTVSSSSFFPFRSKVQKSPSYIEQNTGNDFDKIVSSLPPLPPQFTLKPHSDTLNGFPEQGMDKPLPRGIDQKRHSSKEKISPPARSLRIRAPEDVLGKSRSATDMFVALPDAVLDKSASAIDIFRTSPTGESEPRTSSLPNVSTEQSNTAPAENMRDLTGDVTTWNPLFHEDDREYGRRNLSFDELEESEEDRAAAREKAQSMPSIRINKPTPTTRHRTTSMSSEKQTSTQQRATSLPYPRPKQDVIQDGPRRASTLKPHSTEAGVVRRHSSRRSRERGKREEANRRLQQPLRQITHLRDTAWQSSGVESNESDNEQQRSQHRPRHQTQQSHQKAKQQSEDEPMTQHNENEADNAPHNQLESDNAQQPSRSTQQEPPAVDEDPEPQTRRKRITAKKTFEDDSQKSAETYLEAHDVVHQPRRDRKSQHKISLEPKAEKKPRTKPHGSVDFVEPDDLPRTQSSKGIAGGERKISVQQQQQLAQMYWQQYGQYPQYGPYSTYDPYQQYGAYGGAYGMSYPMQYAASQANYPGYYGYPGYYDYTQNGAAGKKGQRTKKQRQSHI